MTNEHNQLFRSDIGYSLTVKADDMQFKTLKCWCRSNIDKGSWIPQDVEVGDDIFTTTRNEGMATFYFAERSDYEMFETYLNSADYSSELKRRIFGSYGSFRSATS